WSFFNVICLLCKHYNVFSPYFLFKSRYSVAASRTLANFRLATTATTRSTNLRYWHRLMQE
ncbi:hypothetical protein QUA69_27930, partial [Microcoleus sp. LAD1_D1]